MDRPTTDVEYSSLYIPRVDVDRPTTDVEYSSLYIPSVDVDRPTTDVEYSSLYIPSHLLQMLNTLVYIFLATYYRC